MSAPRVSGFAHPERGFLKALYPMMPGQADKKYTPWGQDAFPLLTLIFQNEYSLG